MDGRPSVRGKNELFLFPLLNYVRPAHERNTVAVRAYFPRLSPTPLLGYGTAVMERVRARQRFARHDSRGNGKRGGREEQWVTGLQQNYIPTSDMNSIVTVWGVGCSSFSPAKAS